jgi:hypothetical protein
MTKQNGCARLDDDPLPVARSGGAIHFGVHFSSSGADFAGDLMAALADAAGAAAPLAGLLDDWRGAVVVLRKSFAEIHLTGLCALRMVKSEPTLSMSG